MLSCIKRSIGRKLVAAVGLPVLLIGLAGMALLQSASRGASPDVAAIARLALIADIVLVSATAIVLFVTAHLLVVRPLERLNLVMRQAKAGDFLHRAKIDSTDELGELSSSFNGALAAITDLHARRLEDAESIESMQRELALKAQVEAQHRLLDETNRRLENRLRELTLLYDLTRTLSSTLELDQLLRFISEIVGRNLGFNVFELLLLDESSGELVVKSTFGTDEGLVGTLVPTANSGAGWAAAQRQVLLIRDTKADTGRLHSQNAHLSADGSALWVPMLYKGECVGVLDLFRPVVDAFSQEEVRLLQSVANQAAMAIVNARLHQKTVTLSLTDPLTGLHNRRSLFNHLQMELDRSERFSHAMGLAMIDVDRFKHYNDAMGHPAGDAVLRQMSGLLASSTRKVDTLARYGGEEFVLVLPRAEKAAAFEVAEKLRAEIESTHFEHGELQPGGRITVSVGVASYPEDAQDLATLIDCADAALYCSKREGRNRVSAFAPGMREHPGRRRDIQVTSEVEPVEG
jgi:diguanylate cyclase (GGDEF)-like protein